MKKLSVVGTILVFMFMCLTLTACKMVGEDALGINDSKKEVVVESVEYDVLNVYQYPAAITNGYGGVRWYENRYHVTYTDGENIMEKELHHSNNKDSLSRVQLGDEVKLVREGNVYTLFLTREAFEEMPVAEISN